MSLSDVVAVATVNVTARGTPLASQIRWCFEPVLPLSIGLGAGSGAPFRPDVGGVHARAGLVALPCRVQLCQQHPVQAFEHPVGLPVP